MRGHAVELQEDCPHCRLEGGLAETYDAREAACRFGVPARASCKLCGVTKVGTVSGTTCDDLLSIPTNLCPACRAPLEPEALDVRRCGLCGVRAALVDVTGPADLLDRATLEARLAQWAASEGFDDTEELVRATFVAESTSEVHARLVAGDVLETVMDPFAFGGRATGGSSDASTEARTDERRGPRSLRPVRRSATPPIRVLGADDEPPPATLRIPGAPTVPRDTVVEARPAAPVLAPEAPPPPPLPPSTARAAGSEGHEAHEPPRSAPPRAILYPLVSVISADGEIHPSERAFVDAFLASEGMAPLADDEIRVYSPQEVARYVPKHRREKIVELMCEVAMVDGLGDDAELRVVRAYGSAWQIPEEKVETWLWGYEHAQSSAARQFWLRIRRFVLSSRWENQEP
jgi:uncharacterized tellurite resistance protein B-like protein